MPKVIAATFRRRKTVFPAGDIPALTFYFYDGKTKNTQWRAFLKKGRAAHGQLSLQQVCEEIRETLQDVFEKIRLSKAP